MSHDRNANMLKVMRKAADNKISKPEAAVAIARELRDSKDSYGATILFIYDLIDMMQYREGKAFEVGRYDTLDIIQEAINEVYNEDWGDKGDGSIPF